MNTLSGEWMSWEGGVDLVACTRAGLAMPNVIVHVARLVHTPVGAAASGLVFYQPDPEAAPLVMGFVSEDAAVVGPYFGPKIFAGTPFGAAPVLAARIQIEIGTDYVGAIVTAGGHELRTRLEKLAPPTLVQRAPDAMNPFWQQGVEAAAGGARFWCDGVEVPVLVPPVGISGGAAAVFAPAGLYAR